jgi:hypothetical protein
MSIRLLLRCEVDTWKVRLVPQVEFCHAVQVRDAPVLKRSTYRKKIAQHDIKGQRQYLVVAPDGFACFPYRRVPHWNSEAQCDKGPRNGVIVKTLERKYAHRFWWILTHGSDADYWLPEKYLVLVTV